MERFATALLVEIPHGDSRIEILNCGHPPPLLLNRGELRALEPTTPSPLLNLAELIGDHYTIDTFDFAPGDLLLLYTDGIAEARARDGRFFPLAAWMRQQPRRRPTSCSRLFTATSSTTAEDAWTTTSPPSRCGCVNPRSSRAGRHVERRMRSGHGKADDVRRGPSQCGGGGGEVREKPCQRSPSRAECALATHGTSQSSANGVTRTTPSAGVGFQSSIGR